MPFHIYKNMVILTGQLRKKGIIVYEWYQKNLKDVAYQEIKHRIIDCSYAPNTTLKEETLQSELGISRTPIREALVKLEHDGLVEVIPKKGIRVSGFTLTDVCQLYETRLLIEPYIIRNYGKDIDHDTIGTIRQKHFDLHASLQQGYSESIQKQLYKLDDEFHEMVISGCKNPYLSSTCLVVKAQSQRLRIMLGEVVDTRVMSTVEEHLCIIQELLDREYEEAANTMTQHLAKSQKVSFNTIASNPLLTRF